MAAPMMDLDAKGSFFSPTCSQICRPRPSYAATNRDTIVRYLHEAAEGGTTLATSSQDDKDGKPRSKGFYTIRSLDDGEFEFGTDEVVQEAGFGSTAELKQKAEGEGWVGMRVDLWNDEGVDDDGARKGLLVKVQYWWRKEEGKWTQCFHDIMYLGARDGTEGTEGAEVLE
jgi:hypothetical protein